jgi:LuxR family maltose regulon positive regulatory protein
MAKIAQAMGNYDLASAYLNDFKKIYPWENRLQYRFASAHQTEIHLRVGNIKEAQVWAESFRVKPCEHIRFMDFLFYDVLAQVLIENGQFDEARDLLEILLAISEQAGAAQLEAQTLGRLSLVLKKIGKPDAAFTMLESALAYAVPEGYLRTFIDQGHDMAKLVYQASLQGIYPGFCKQILDGFSNTAAFVHASPELVEPLSHREIEILSHIAEGCTNQEIAQELVISLYTVKTHAGNIYSKLGVKNRTEAVAKARSLGILTKD